MTDLKPFVSVIIPAAGQGTRMKSSENKLLIPLDEIPLIVYSLKVFIQSSSVQEVILVVPPGKVAEYEPLLEKWIQKGDKISVVEGGARRQDSVHNGLKTLSSSCDVVMVHDGARPFVTEKMIQDSIQTALKVGGCVIGVPCKSTLKECDQEQIVVRTPPRDRLWEVQTPQTFQVELLKKAFEKAEKENLDVTDEGMLLEALGHSVKIVEGDYTNIKVTTPEDLLLAELILKRR